MSVIAPLNGLEPPAFPYTQTRQPNAPKRLDFLDTTPTSKIQIYIDILSEKNTF
jgi:hypothetical protein